MRRAAEVIGGPPAAEEVRWAILGENAGRLLGFKG